MKTATITLNDEQCELRELKTRELAEWLRKLEGPLVEALAVATELVGEELGEDTEATAAVVSKIADLLSGSIDQVLDLMIEFAPYLKDQANECWTSEIVPAFTEVLKLAVPFDLSELDLGGLVQAISEQAGSLGMPGSKASPTGTSLPEQPGDSGQTKPTS